MSPKVEPQTSELPVPSEVSVFHHHLSQVKKVLYPAQLGFTPLPPQARPQLLEHAHFAQQETIATVEIPHSNPALPVISAQKELNSAHNSPASMVRTILIQVGHHQLLVLPVQMDLVVLKEQ